jgi:hypothetical protein
MLRTPLLVAAMATFKLRDACSERRYGLLEPCDARDRA